MVDYDLKQELFKELFDSLSHEYLMTYLDLARVMLWGDEIPRAISRALMIPMDDVWRMRDELDEYMMGSAGAFLIYWEMHGIEYDRNKFLGLKRGDAGYRE